MNVPKVFEIKLKLIIIRLMWLSCLFLFLACPLSASSTYEPLSDIGNSAGMIGIGNIEGFDEGAASLMQNPASLSTIYRISISTFYASFLKNDVQFMSGAIACRLPVGVVAIGAIGTEIGGIDHTGQNNGQYYSESMFSYRDITYKAGYEVDLSRDIHVGVAGSYFTQQSYQSSAWGVNLDAGVYINFDALEVSLTGKNILGKALHYKEPTATVNLVVPATYLMSVRIPLGILPGMNFYGQYKSVPAHHKELLAAGARYELPIFSMLSISAGWQEYLVLDAVQNKTSVGVVLNMQTLKLNFAYEKSNYFQQDNQYYFSVDLNL
ncbi:MAG: hypothetical protein EXS67_02945 [Candidatus Margulisbacteria bacterium]|nr:hypothetical protein [Candidatus Margulisiibacteriota bacterium]